MGDKDRLVMQSMDFWCTCDGPSVSISDSRARRGNLTCDAEFIYYGDGENIDL